MTDGFQLTPDDLEHFASGSMPHERPSPLAEYVDRLRRQIQELGLAHNMDFDYNAAITDVLEVMDNDDA